MVTNLPQNNNQPDPDFEPEQQVNQPVDPDFEPENSAPQHDPDFQPENLISDIGKSVESNFPNATAIVKGVGEKIFSVAKDIAADPNMQSLDPATKAGMTIANAGQSVYDEVGTKVAEKLAYHGLNPYVSAAAGFVTSEIPNILLSAEGIMAAKAAGNAAAESKMLNAIFKKVEPLALEHKPQLGGSVIDIPALEISSGEPIPLESKAMGLLKGKKQLELPEPNITRGPKPKEPLYRGTASDDPEFTEYPGKYVSTKRSTAESYAMGAEERLNREGKGGYVHTYEYKGDKTKFLDVNSKEFDSLVKRFVKEHPEDLQLSGEFPDYAYYPTPAWKKFMSEKGYEGTKFEDEIFVFDPSKLSKAEQFIMRDKPDLAKLQQQESISGQPKYPEDMGASKTMRGYAARRRLSSDIPEFPKLQEAVAPADQFNPAMSELVDESRKQYVGIDPRLQVTKDMETGRTTFRLKRDPQFEKRVVTEAEVISDNATKNSQVVKSLDIDPRIVDSSPVLQGSEQVPVLKDGVVAGSESWIQSAWNRIGVASEDVISRMGAAGKELANGIRTVRDVPQVRYGDFAAGFDKFLQGMSRKQAKEASIALADALEGKKISTKLPDGMLEYVQQKLKVIADEAEQVNLSIRNQAGEIVPFAPRENYYPRMLRQEIFDGLLAGDNKVMAKMAQKMVDNRQEVSVPIAFERVKYMRNKMSTMKYGHLERAREFDLPAEFYDRNSLRVIPEYINNALHRIEEARQFGVQGEKALDVLSRIKDEGGDAGLARTIFERFTRIEPRDKVYLKGAQGLRNLAAGMLIQAQSTVLQVGQALMPAYEAGFTNAVKGFAKAFTTLGEEQAMRAGQVFTTAAQDYLKEAYGGAYGFAGKFADSMLNVTGFARMDHFLRKYSSLVGREYIEKDLVPALLKNNSSKKAVVELQNLGFDVAKIIRNKGVSEQEINVGAKIFADNTQGAPDVTRLPEFWTTWQGKLLGQFKNFSYVIGKQNASMIKRALETGNVARLGEMAIGLPLTGYAINKLREGMTGESNVQITGQEDVDAAIEVLSNATAFGPSIDLFLLALQGGDKLNTFFLPTSVKNITELTGAAGKSLKEQDLSILLKTATKKIPVAGRLLYKKIYGE